MRVGQSQRGRVGAEDDVAHLNATGWNDVAKRKVKLAQELREVVQENHQQTQRPMEQCAGRVLELGGTEEGLQETEQGYEEAVVWTPSLLQK